MPARCRPAWAIPADCRSEGHEPGGSIAYHESGVGYLQIYCGWLILGQALSDREIFGCDLMFSLSCWHSYRNGKNRAYNAKRQTERRLFTVSFLHFVLANRHRPERFQRIQAMPNRINPVRVRHGLIAGDLVPTSAVN